MCELSKTKRELSKTKKAAKPLFENSFFIS